MSSNYLRHRIQHAQSCFHKIYLLKALLLFTILLYYGGTLDPHLSLTPAAVLLVEASSPSSLSSSSSSSSSPYKTLAKYLSRSIPHHSVPSIQSALEYLSKSQSTLKSIDGASHEFYQFSHKNTIEGSTGRIERSAGRIGCCADSLLACELLDWADRMIHGKDVSVDRDKSILCSSDGLERHKDKDDNNTYDDDDDQDTLDLNERKMVLNVTLEDPIPLHVIVLFEPNYNGGAGMNHGGIDGLTNNNDNINNSNRLDDESVGGISVATTVSATATAITANRGRYLIIIQDGLQDDLEKTLECLDSDPEFFELDVGLVSEEVASVNKVMWVAAQRVLEECANCWGVGDDDDDDDEWDRSNVNLTEEDKGKGGGLEASEDTSSSSASSAAAAAAADGGGDGAVSFARSSLASSTLPALHFVGRSLAGGVASLAAALVDGSIPMPPPEISKRKGRKLSKSHKTSNRGTMGKRSRRRRQSIQGDSTEENAAMDGSSSKSIPISREDARAKRLKTLHGFGMGRASAVALGSPPCISANIKAAFVTSVICGDDIVCRATQKSLERLRQRTIRRLEGGVLMKQVGWMTDALSLTISGLQSHAHGSEGEEARLSIPGRVYLVRPRRHGGGVSSMHEIGRGRDALRAAVLWQLNDVLLSRSLWKHHLLHSYIASIDKVGLRTMDEEDHDPKDLPEEMYS